MKLPKEYNFLHGDTECVHEHSINILEQVRSLVVRVNITPDVGRSILFYGGPKISRKFLEDTFALLPLEQCVIQEHSELIESYLTPP